MLGMKFQAPTPPVGSDETATSPASPTTHSVTDGHDTESKAERYPPGSVGWIPVQVDAPPAGAVVVRIDGVLTPSPPPTATQRLTLGHDTDVRNDCVEGPIDHACAPLVGSVVVRMWPAPSTATQSDVDGQEMLSMLSPVRAPSSAKYLHASDPPVGLVETKRSPLRFAATQSDLDGQEMAVIPPCTVAACAAATFRSTAAAVMKQRRIT